MQDRIRVKDENITKDEFMVSTFSHESYHDIDLDAIKAINDKQNGVVNNYSFEPPAYRVQRQVHKEIKSSRLAREDSEWGDIH